MGTHHGGLQPPASSADVAFFREHGYSPGPLLVQWLVTTACSLRCPHCSAAELQPRHASARLITRLLDQIADLRVPQLLLTGGEPLEHPAFPEILGEIARRNISWSLNTATHPDARARAAIGRHPPKFVAVSVDGPADVHDAFRGRPGALESSMAAIRWFRQCGVEGVAAGTTVTSRNIAHLDETFAMVAASGATSWGLHLTVLDGRAVRAPGLALTPSQTRSLIRFVARRRLAFPVNMADEIGFCGQWEPLLRDSPFYCGAGRTHCVVLPDGSVVPCTTVDSRDSTGNVVDTDLAELWRDGFCELRSWKPTGRCERCEHAMACSGGCWLQRRHGHHCHRPAWDHRLAPVITACAALSACTGPKPATPAAPPSAPAIVVSAATPPPVVSSSPPPVSPAPAASVPEAAHDDTIFGTPRPPQMDTIDWAFLRHAVDSPVSLCNPRAAITFREAGASLLSDSLAVYFTALAQPSCKESLADRVSTIRTSLGTTRRSITLLSTIWRDLQEWGLDGPRPDQRSPQDRALLKSQIVSLGRTVEAWRAESLARQLDGFLYPDPSWPRAMMSKAGPPPGMSLLDEVATRRWAPAPARHSLARAYLAQHPVGESLSISIAVSAPNAVVIVSPKGERRVGNQDRIGIFDLLTVPAAAKAPVTVTMRLGQVEIRTSVAPGLELTYLDLSRAAIDADRATMEAGVSRTGSADIPDTFLIPLLRQRVSQGEAHKRNSMLRRLAAAWLF